MLKPKQATVRSATSADTAAICAIYNEAISLRGSTFETEHRGTADFDERIAVERLPFLVADVDGTVTGWAALAPYSSRPCYAGIGEASVYVASDARGRGVGTALAEMLATRRSAGTFTSCWASCSPTTSPASDWSGDAVSPRLGYTVAMDNSTASGETCLS